MASNSLMSPLAALRRAALVAGVLAACAGRADAAYWSPTLIDMPAGVTVDIVRGVDASGQVSGRAYVAGQGGRGFLYAGGTATMLGTFGGSASEVSATAGSYAAGYAHTSGNGALHAFRSQGGTLTDLGTLGGGFSAAVDVNAAGDVAGDSSTATGQLHAFRYSAGTMTDLGTLGGGSYSRAIGINAGGQVAGTSGVGPGAQHAFLWNGGMMTDLGTLGGTMSWARDINDAGQVIGGSTLANGFTHAFRYDNGTMTDLGTLGGGYNQAWDLNSAGDVVGQSERSDGAYHAYVWRNGTMTDLGTLSGGDSSLALEVNDAGYVLGLSMNAGDTDYFLHDGQAIIDLAALVAGLGIVDITQAALGEGHIAGIGDLADGSGRVAFLLTLTQAPGDLPAPPTLALALVGLAAAAMTRRPRRTTVAA